MEVYSVKDTEHGISLSFFPKSLPKAFKKFTVETSAVLKKHKESTEARDIFACRHTLPESVERAAASVSALPGVVETGAQVRTASGGEDGGGTAAASQTQPSYFKNGEKLLKSRQ